MLSWLCQITLTGACVAVPLHGYCQVYVGVTPAGGSIVLSNFQSQEAPELLLALPGSETGSKLQTGLGSVPRFTLPTGVNAKKLRAMIESVASSLDVAPQLIHAVIAAESNYDPKAVSVRGAIGLMQLMPATARRFGVIDPFVERDNVFAGASYLKWLMNYFGGDIELVLAAYNAGEQAVVKAGRKIPRYPETQAYVHRVMANLQLSGSLPL